MAKKEKDEQSFTNEEMEFIVEHAMTLARLIKVFVSDNVKNLCMKIGHKQNFGMVQLMVAGAVHDFLEDVANGMEWDVEHLCEEFCNTLMGIVKTKQELDDNEKEGGNYEEK